MQREMGLIFIEFDMPSTSILSAWRAASDDRDIGRDRIVTKQLAPTPRLGRYSLRLSWLVTHTKTSRGVRGVENEQGRSPNLWNWLFYQYPIIRPAATAVS